MEKSSKDHILAVGGKLRTAREKKGLTIESVQKDTRIHSTVIRALEEGRCDEILTSTYVKSFLKKYAQYLGLDSKDILNQYAFSSADESQEKAALTIRRQAEIRVTKSLSKTIHFVSIALLAVVFLSLVVFIGKAIGPALKKPRPAAKVVQTAAISKKAVKKPPSAKKETPAPAKTAKKEPFSLTIKVKRSVLIEAKKDGILVFKRSMPKGTEETISANDKIELFIARGESVELIFNGKNLGSPGKGTIRDLEITSGGIKAK